MLLRMLFPIGQLVSCALLLYTFCTIFAALHGMQTRSSDDNSVRLAGCLSVKRVDCEKNGRIICPDFLYHMREEEEEWLVGATHST